MPVRITLKPNGPIMISAEGDPFPVLHTATGEDVRPEKNVFLCRCGESANKPFCDGSHARVGYSDENRCTRDALLDADAPGITVHFNRAICSGAGECVRGLPAVFVSGAKDWIRPAEASVAEVIATVKKCPSGALTYSVDGQTRRRDETEVRVRIVKDGPYEITGPVEFDPPRWSANASKTCFALCRCGRSANAPFCDYSHGEQGWKDSGEE
ncbi:MAG: CDGSH iron-sulfur domain-containing protein [Candidatus Krumholzibacteriia bacterium]